MSESLKWGILATGNIARQFAEGLKTSKSGTLQAVGSRSVESANAFAADHGGTPYGTYEEVLADQTVEAVYIATPHHLHYEWTIKAAQAGKAILCEKPFTLNALEAERALEHVKENGVFFMEAFMYRCHPQTKKVKELVDAGRIGKPLHMVAEFGYASKRDWDNFRAVGAVGGGALMDVGLYPVSYARLIAGEEPVDVGYTMQLNDQGADANGAGFLKFPSGFIAHFGTAIAVQLRNDLTIFGEDGFIHVDNPWKCREGRITLQRNGEEPEQFELITTNAELYGIEADTVAANLGSRQASEMSWEDTLGNMRALDALRKSAGLSFAEEMR